MCVEEQHRERFLQLENAINISKFFPFHNKYDTKLVNLRYDLETLSTLVWNIQRIPDMAGLLMNKFK